MLQKYSSSILKMIAIQISHGLVVHIKSFTTETTDNLHETRKHWVSPPLLVFIFLIEHRGNTLDSKFTPVASNVAQSSLYLIEGWKPTRYCTISVHGTIFHIYIFCNTLGRRYEGISYGEGWSFIYHFALDDPALEWYVLLSCPHHRNCWWILYGTMNSSFSWKQKRNECFFLSPWE